MVIYFKTYQTEPPYLKAFRLQWAHVNVLTHSFHNTGYNVEIKSVWQETTYWREVD